MGIPRGKAKKKNKKKKKAGARGNGTMSANDLVQHTVGASSPALASPSTTKSRHHRHSLPEDFAQTHKGSSDTLQEID